MDKAFDFGSKDCGFDSRRGRFLSLFSFFFFFSIFFKLLVNGHFHVSVVLLSKNVKKRKKKGRENTNYERSRTRDLLSRKESNP